MNKQKVDFIISNVYYPPNNATHIRCKDIDLFLAGSVEMGNATEWQADFINQFKPTHDDTCSKINVHVFNPRRPDWDSTWTQKIENFNFYEQVTWELNHLEKSDVVALYFAANTMSPISLLEMGLCARSDKLVVFNDPKYLRNGNVEITCNKFGIECHKDYKNWILGINNKIINKYEIKNRNSITN